MSPIRPVSEEDVEQIADLFQRVLRRVRHQAPAPLVAYLRSLFLEPLFGDADIRSLVYTRSDGRIAGFIGVQPMQLSMRGRPLRGAMFSSLMVDDHAQNPLAGALLLRSAMAGPQDISFAVTANETSTCMWRNLRGSMLRDYSLDWLRILKPTSLLVELAARRLPATRLLRPVARAADAMLGRLAGPHASPAKKELPAADAGRLVDREIDDEALIGLIPVFTASFDVAPQWSPQQLRRMLADAAMKPDLGPFCRRLVSDRSGNAVGAYVYHGRPGRIGQVLQIFAAPGNVGPVLDCMVARAADSGFVALRGRTQPHLIDDMVPRRFIFTHTTSSLVAARDPTLLAPFRSGSAFLNGLAGESWTRLADGRFD